ncbi:MAG: hypothetical protein OXG39_02920 [Chloroflexi bacterium]|nr:hypothetical protein [Chloroflexota bacterium]
MRVAKYWRNNKLRYRLIRGAEGAGRKLEVKPKSKDRRHIALRREAALEAETA